MIDIAKLQYQLIAVTPSGTQLDITGATEDLTWEEGESELALRLSFTAHNAKYGGSPLSSVLQPGCIVSVMAEWGAGKQEVARGRITEWDPKFSGSERSVSIMAYDDLLNLQQSQDNRYYSAGTGTKSALTAIFSDWGIPLGEYRGPNVAHAKTMYKGEYLGDIINQLLDDAAKKGAGRCFLRYERGAVSVLPEGGNSTIYHFGEDGSTTVSRDSMNTTGLITRVKIVGREDESGQQAVEAIESGLTQYGIRQQIYVRSEDDTLTTATSAARGILSEQGQPQRNRSVSAPDVPVVRKGDKVHVQAGTLNGYFIVSSVRHDADSRSMQMDLKPAEGGQGQGSGVNNLAQVIQERANECAKSPLLLDFGSIQDDLSLLTNTYPIPIPKSAYTVCRQLTLGRTGARLTGTLAPNAEMPEQEGDGVHSHPDGVIVTEENGDHPGHISGQGKHSHLMDGRHVHTVLIPEKMRKIKAGDRVLVAWVQTEAVVVDIILPASVL